MVARTVSMHNTSRSLGSATLMHALRCASALSALGVLVMLSALEAPSSAPSWSSALLRVVAQNAPTPLVMSKRHLATNMIAQKVTFAHQRRPASIPTA